MARPKKGKGNKQPASPPPTPSDTASGDEAMDVAQARARSPTPPLPDPLQSDEDVDVQPAAKKDKKSVNLTAEQEEAVIEFLKQHEAIFIMKLGGFRHTNLKDAAWGELAETLGLPMVQKHAHTAGETENQDEQEWGWYGSNDRQAALAMG